MATVTVEVVGLPRLGLNLSDLERRALPRALARTLNSVATTVRKEDIRKIARFMGVKQSVVRERTDIKRATPKQREPMAQIRYKGRRMNLIRFGARQRQKGVSARPWGKRRIFPQTFIVDLGTGVPFVAVRKQPGASQRHEYAGKYQPARRVGRIPVVGVVGPGVAETAAMPEFADARKKRARELIVQRLPRELAFYTARMRG